jgi:type VI protein secretion system component VasF
MSVFSDRQKRALAAANAQMRRRTNHMRGRVAVPILLWIAGVPFTLVFFIWLFFFRGH